MKVEIGFSPCPNDTFIFDALVNKKIDTRGIDFTARLEDVETLNRLALEGTLAITKISYAVLPLVLDEYIVLNSGSALGTGVGPLLIAQDVIPYDEVNNCIIAIPGEYTTAHMLFNLAYPGAKNKIFMRYDEIENFVSGKNTLRNQNTNSNDNAHFSLKRAGVIIHENRFTYEKKGLKKIMDLGDFWQEKTGFPIPLGGIIGKRMIGSGLLLTIDGLVRQSIEYAYNNYPELTDYIRINSQEMEEDVMRKHIELYVNNYSINLGTAGRSAVDQFLQIKQIMEGGNDFALPVFLEQS
ncbi:MAG: 1,4-dihydroxy-6-naphthoate synthase [Ginsengibacter sp.]